MQIKGWQPFRQQLFKTPYIPYGDGTERTQEESCGYTSEMTRSKITSSRKQKSHGNEENRIEVNWQGLMEHRRLMSKLLTTKRLAIKNFCAHQSKRLARESVGSWGIKEALKKDNGRAEQLNAPFMLMFPPGEHGEFPAPEYVFVGNTLGSWLKLKHQQKRLWNKSINWKAASCQDQMVRTQDLKWTPVWNCRLLSLNIWGTEGDECNANF